MYIHEASSLMRAHVPRTNSSATLHRAPQSLHLWLLTFFEHCGMNNKRNDSMSTYD